PRLEAARDSACLRASTDEKGGGGGIARCRWPAGALPVPPAPRSVDPEPASQCHLHAIVRHFPARFSNDAVFHALFIQNRIGVVDVNENLAWPIEPGEAFETSTRSRERQVAHLPRSAGHARDGQGFVIAPERPVKKHHVAALQALAQYIRDARNSRQER